MEKLLNLCEPGTELVSKYVNAKTSITLKCTNGHNRSIIPSNLISKGNGRECRECKGLSSNARKTTASFAAQLSALYPNITVVGEYTNAKVPIKIQCTCGNCWEAIPSNLLTRSSDAVCRSCTPINYASTKEEVTTKLQQHYPFLSVVHYTNSSVRSTILDSRCGTEFEAYVGNIIDKHKWRCPTCNPNSSQQEQELLDYIKAKYSGWVETHDRKVLEGKEIDILLPELGWGIEFNGTYYHSKYDKNYHQNKSILAEQQGFQLYHIWDDDYQNNKELVYSKIDSILSNTYKIAARKCSVREIDWPKEFLEQNHIQGKGSPSSINYGLFFNEELVAVMTFSKSKFAQYAEYELVRYCSLSGTTIVGGASKLLKASGLTSVFSYSNYDLGSGNMYDKLGFRCLGLTQPGYFYINGYNRRSRTSSTKDKLYKEFGVQEGTEEEILFKHGYNKVYNCGSKIWVLEQ